MNTFFDLYMYDKVSIDDLDKFLEEWHKSTSNESVEDYLGLTKEQYFTWCDDPNKLKSELDKIKHTKYVYANKKIAKELVKLAKELVE